VNSPNCSPGFAGALGVWIRSAGRDDRRDIAFPVNCLDLGLLLFGLAGAVAGTIAGLVVWEWWALIKVAKALGTSIAKLIPMDQTLKVAFVVAVGVLVAHIVSSELDASVFLRLVAKSLAFMTTVLLGFVLTKVHHSLISLVRGTSEAP